MSPGIARSPGVIEAIFLAPRKGGARSEVAAARAIAGRGLEGDFHCLAEGAPAKPSHAGQEVTLIEREALEALDHEAGIPLEPAETRRNLLTHGVRLNDLVGREFTVGEVTLRGIELCDPCSHLERLTMPGVEAGLENRGGLRAQIVRGGTIRRGDPIMCAVCCQIDDTTV